MKRIGWIGAVLAVLWLGPRLSHPAVDIGKLEPVELVLLTVSEDGVRLETDTGCYGVGRTPRQAAKALREGAPGEVYLDTTDKLLILGEVEEWMWRELYEIFRPSCRVYRVEQVPDIQVAASYLSAHKGGMTLNEHRGGLEKWDTLMQSEGRGQLVPK